MRFDLTNGNGSEWSKMWKNVLKEKMCFSYFIINLSHISRPKIKQISNSGEQEWRNGESTRLAPMWPEYDSGTRRPSLCGLNFLVRSRLAPRVFLRVLRFPSLSTKWKQTLLNSNSIGNPRATGLLVARLLCATLVKESTFIFSHLI